MLVEANGFAQIIFCKLKKENRKSVINKKKIYKKKVSYKIFIILKFSYLFFYLFINELLQKFVLKVKKKFFLALTH